MRLSWLAAAIVGDVLRFAPRFVAASEGLWIQPSGVWYGIDGTWSAFSFGVGSPLQTVDLTISTALSEIWVIESTGCSATVLCTSARGGVFNVSGSATWKSVGTYQLGLNDLNMGGNGDYGLETIAWTNTLTRTTTAVDGVVMAGLNDTDFYQGFIGVGANSDRFPSNLSTNSLISQLAEDYGTIPSHSYGYTAGAYYAGNNGTVASLVLGGYDPLRFVSHDTMFTLDPNVRLPTLRVRGVTAAVPSVDRAPTRWNSTSQALVSFNDNVTALIDTTTPYLWLPQTICDRFAAALNLTWSEDFGLYLFQDGAQYTSFQQDSSLSFVFSVSSYDNDDNFGQPLDTQGVINITIPSAAFAQILRYPFENKIEFGSSGVPYFPLKRTNSSTLVIGRAFMQEAYLKVVYDDDQFSIHQALFPENAPSNYSVQTIARPADSGYAPYVDTTSSKSLSTGQTAGIVVGAFAIGCVLAASFWLCCRRRRRSKAQQAGQLEANKEDSDSFDSEQPRSPVRRMFSLIIGRKRSRKPAANEVPGDSAQPAEVANHELHELPVPLEPVELDSTDSVGDDSTQLGTEGTEGLSAYEVARRKLDRQLQGPVPAYTPTAENEKSEQDISSVPHYRPSDEPSPASSPTYGTQTNSMPEFLPSPITPYPDNSPRHFDFPSPLTVVPPIPSARFPSNTSDPSSGTYYLPSPNSPHSSQSAPRTFEPSSVSRSDSSNASPTSPIRPSLPPAPTVQRTPIDPSRVVCLGPLPENVQLQLQRHQPPVPRIVTPNTETDGAPGRSLSRTGRRGSSDSLGSNFTLDEENRNQHGGPRQQQAEGEGSASGAPRSPRSMERIQGGAELVHVPQVAEKRYSWEEGRTT